MKEAMLEQALRFTAAYRKYKHDHPAIREIMCLREQYPYSLQPIQHQDLFAGRYKRGLVRFTPHDCDELAFEYDLKALQSLLSEDMTDSNKAAVQNLIDYWQTERTAAKVRAAYPPDLAEKLPSDNWYSESGIAFPLYRMCGVQLNFDHLLQMGLPGLREEVASYRLKALETQGEAQLYDSMLLALDLLVDMCLHYAAEAAALSQTADNDDRKQELEAMAAALTRITHSKPSSLREAIQLFWMYALVSGTRNYGRMDVYLGDFYAQDIRTGALTEEQALSMLQSLWRLIASTKTVFESRIIIGGVGRRNVEHADMFAFAAMEATRTVLEIEPQLSLRCYTGMNPQLMEKALEVIGAGRTYPILYNDDVNVVAVEHAFDVPREEAEQYVPFGCGEYILDHRSVGTPSGVINALKALEVTLHNGIDPFTNKAMGIQTGAIHQFTTFEQLVEAYKAQVEYYVQAMAQQEELEYRVVGENAAYLFTSMLYDNCLERGKGIFSGGVQYLGGTLETYGNINAANSLTAIKEVVYDAQMYTLEQLVEMLDANFEGFEAERNVLLAASKFGNDLDEADRIAMEVHEHISTVIRNQREHTNLHSYLNVVINNQANTLMGNWTAASADGRLSREPMANGNTPSGGTDRKGLTALLNSLVKLEPSIHAGAVHNLKCSRQLIIERKLQFKALLNTYFAKGGTQAMITVVNRNELEQALLEPKKYTHIFVRVGGFSARFVELDPAVQAEILSRTLY